MKGQRSELEPSCPLFCQTYQITMFVWSHVANYCKSIKYPTAVQFNTLDVHKDTYRCPRWHYLPIKQSKNLSSTFCRSNLPIQLDWVPFYEIQLGSGCHNPADAKVPVWYAHWLAHCQDDWTVRMFTCHKTIPIISFLIGHVLSGSWHYAKGRSYF